MDGTHKFTTDETASNELLTGHSVSTGRLDLTALPARLDDKLLSQVRAIALSAPPAYAPCDREHFDKCMRSLAILPRKADDDVKGDLRHQLYWRKLQTYPAAAMSWLVEQGLEQFEWFPSVKQCKDLLDVWPSPTKARLWRTIAHRKVEEELRLRFEDLCDRVRRRELTEEEINALPDRVKSRLDCACLIIGEKPGPFEPMVYRLRPPPPEEQSPQAGEEQAA